MSRECRLASVRRFGAAVVFVSCAGREKGKGKRGGLRVIYFWDEPSETFHMLYVYRKSAQDDLTMQQRKLLTRLVREEFG